MKKRLYSSRHVHLIGIERLKIASAIVRSILHAFPQCSGHNGLSSDTLRRVDGIVVASTMQTRADNTTRVLVHLEQEEKSLQERYVDCRVKSAGCSGISRCISECIASVHGIVRPLELRHTANTATRDYYGNRAPSFMAPSRPPILHTSFPLRTQCTLDRTLGITDRNKRQQSE